MTKEAFIERANNSKIIWYGTKRIPSLLAVFPLEDEEFEAYYESLTLLLATKKGEYRLGTFAAIPEENETTWKGKWYDADGTPLDKNEVVAWAELPALPQAEDWHGKQKND